MLCEISKDGLLILVPRSQTDGYAINQFVKDTTNQVVQGTWRPEMSADKIRLRDVFIITGIAPRVNENETDKPKSSLSVVKPLFPKNSKHIEGDDPCQSCNDLPE